MRMRKWMSLSFLVLGLLGAASAVIWLGISSGLFESKVSYEVELESVDGLRVGTAVEISGLKIGRVTDLDLKSIGQFTVTFNVRKRFANLFRKDTKILTVRPNVIGEKILLVEPGSPDAELLAEGSQVTVEKSTDLMEALGGKKLNQILADLGKIADNLKIIGYAFTDKNRSKAFVKLFDDMGPFVKNVTEMSRQVNVMAKDLNDDKIFAETLSNLNALTVEFQKLTPAINAVAPELPRASQRAIEALDEMVVTLKAMQKSFLLKSNVREVKEEEQRLPASDPATEGTK